ncbi:MAG: branched-chain amino acid transaminase [Caldilineaceae bacterium SB0662_bin_9]|uniref:Branched-chain-amino-acid aminotransferase n=1 Tax=Caldilineaceae bacterium SB0662_bin_9 TaxID=2605258 RepID=A0A6B1DTK9_9CHLR|nr:branched-chain amino acid transaminase [Caldilineaceae bacterium SB0666_bin_21]MYD90125.1 branched-chain amino acid transaminase [Caldilineaceae bacterium SB0662_bin_9]
MRADYIWMNGEVIPWDQATVHVFAHALHYGSSAFEGIRAYEINGTPHLFRAREHYERLLFSCKVAHMESPLDVDGWIDVSKQVLRANRLAGAYIRPLVFRGYDSLGVDGRGCPIDAILGAVPWGKYLGEEAIEQGVDVQVSSWRRMSSNSFSPMAKIGGQYVNSQNVVMEAKDNGFVEGIVLDANDNVSEGSGENIFLVIDDRIYTPPVASSILRGITRDSAIKIARSKGFDVREEFISREMLYLADEIFFSGTAAEITPVRSVDRMPVGSGQRGPVTKEIQATFFGIVEDGARDEWGWLEAVPLD